VHSKVLKGFGGAGIIEIIERDEYCIKTPKQEIDLIKL